MTKMPIPLIFTLPEGQEFYPLGVLTDLGDKSKNFWMGHQSAICSGVVELGNGCMHVYGWLRKGEVPITIDMRRKKLCFIVEKRPHYDHEKNIHQLVNRIREIHPNAKAFYGTTEILGATE